MHRPIYDGLVSAYNKGDRSLAARRAVSLRSRAAYESACATCGGPCWGRYVPGRRCQECVRRDAKTRHRAQPRGLVYQHR